jgi:hypothetical protein
MVLNEFVVLCFYFMGFFLQLHYEPVIEFIVSYDNHLKSKAAGTDKEIADNRSHLYEIKIIYRDDPLRRSGPGKVQNGIEKKDGKEGGKKGQEEGEPFLIVQEQVGDTAHGQEENPQTIIIGSHSGGQYLQSINSHVPKEGNRQEGEIETAERCQEQPVKEYRRQEQGHANREIKKGCLVDIVQNEETQYEKQQEGRA